MEIISSILASIIGFILEVSFEVGLFVFNILDFKNTLSLQKEGKLKEEMSSFSLKKLMISLVGGLIIILITTLVIFLIIYLFFKSW